MDGFMLTLGTRQRNTREKCTHRGSKSAQTLITANKSMFGAYFEAAMEHEPFLNDLPIYKKYQKMLSIVKLVYRRTFWIYSHKTRSNPFSVDPW